MDPDATARYLDRSVARLSHTAEHCSYFQGHCPREKCSKLMAKSGLLSFNESNPEQLSQSRFVSPPRFLVASSNPVITYSHVHSNLKFRLGFCRIYTRSFQEQVNSVENETLLPTMFGEGEKHYLERTCSNGGQPTAILSSQNSLPIRSDQTMYDIPECWADR